MAPESPHPRPGDAPPGYAHPGHAPPGYGYAPPGHAPPGHAPQGYPPQGYGAPPPYGHFAAPVDPRVARLKEHGTTWLIVTVLGFAVGLGWLTGPLAWYKSAKIRAEYRALGMTPCGNVSAAWVISIVTTVLLALFLLLIVGFYAMFLIAYL